MGLSNHLHLKSPPFGLIPVDLSKNQKQETLCSNPEISTLLLQGFTLYSKALSGVEKVLLSLFSCLLFNVPAMHGEYKQQWERDKRLKYHLHAVSYLKYSLGTLMNEVIFLITMSGQFFFFNYNSSFKCWHFLMQVSFNSCYDPLILEGFPTRYLTVLSSRKFFFLSLQV